MNNQSKIKTIAKFLIEMINNHVEKIPGLIKM